MTSPSHCPKCQSENIYQDVSLWVCPDCGHEWNPDQITQTIAEDPVDDGKTRDSFGQILNDGDSVTVLKELKIKGATSSVKVGTRVKNIRIVDGPDGHDISCKIDGVGSIYLKSEFVKKA